MTKRLLTLIALIALAIISLPAKELHVFRTDTVFNLLNLDDNLSIAHHTGEDAKIAISHADRYNESLITEVPIRVIDRIEVTDATVPTLHFTFPDFPNADWVTDKEKYIAATLSVEGAGVVEDASDLALQVKGRGNSTWGFPKKPMRLKFNKKTSICGFKKAKSYVLLADYIDALMMRNAYGHWLARRMGIPYSNHTQPCNVYVNGKYHGLYLLTEKVGINGSSVDIDESTGILLEMGIEMDEKYQFKSEEFETPIMVKDPDFDELYADEPGSITPQERLAIWQEDYNRAEKKVEAGQGLEEFDLESVVNYILVMNVVRNDEIGFPKSLYLYKEKLGEKYKFGPCWDFDVSGNFLGGTRHGTTSIENPVVKSPTSEIWLPSILYEFTSYPEVVDLYQKKFATFEEEIFPEMLTFIDEYADTIAPYAMMDAMRWPEEEVYSWCTRKNSYDRQQLVTSLKEWLTARVNYLSSQAKQGKF